jgi:NAD+ synthase
MPCGNTLKDSKDAKLLLKRNNIPYKIINFENIFDKFQENVEKRNYKSNLEDVTDYSKKLALANTKARIRMMFLYYYSQINKYMVLGTGNRTELEIGYFTKYGDGGVDILPLAGLFKREVIELGKILRVPSEILEKTPSGGLWKNQTDEDEIGLSYDELEYGIRKYYKLKSEPELELNHDIDYIIKKTSELIRKNKHKKKAPPGFKVERND